MPNSLLMGREWDAYLGPLSCSICTSPSAGILSPVKPKDFMNSVSSSPSESRCCVFAFSAESREPPQQIPQESFQSPVAFSSMPRCLPSVSALSPRSLCSSFELSLENGHKKSQCIVSPSSVSLCWGKSPILQLTLISLASPSDILPSVSSISPKSLCSVFDLSQELMHTNMKSPSIPNPQSPFLSTSQSPDKSLISQSCN